MVHNNSWGKARMSFVSHHLQHFLERIMPGALEEHGRKVNRVRWWGRGRTITNLWFADDIDALAEEDQELKAGP